MTILDRLVEALREARGPIRSSELAGRLDVSESALDGMISVVTAKGVLTVPEHSGAGEAIACSGTACGTTCVGLDECPFIVSVPDTYTLVVEQRLPMPGGPRPDDG